MPNSPGGTAQPSADNLARGGAQPSADNLPLSGAQPSADNPALGSIQLSAGNLAVGIEPDCGAALTRFDIHSPRGLLHILRPAIGPEIAARSPYGASCFAMLPYAGRLRGGTFAYGRRRVTFPLNVPSERHSSHGDGWQRPWRVDEVTAACACLRVTASDRDALRYDALQRIRLTPDSLEIQLEVTNREPDPLPIGVGLHPYFARRVSACLTATLPIRHELDVELMPTGPCHAAAPSHLRPHHPVAEMEPVNIYEGWDGTAEIAWPEDRLRVRLTTSPALRHAVIWVPRGESFFCFEPVSHATDGFNSERYAGELHVLEPGETLIQTFELSVRLS